MSERELHLNLFSPWGGGSMAAWRHPSVDPRAPWKRDWIIELAKNAERGLFDAIFLADSQSLGEHSATGGQTSPEPITVLSLIAGHTDFIGLGATVSTTYNEPYNTARQIASLDQLSGGRGAWNAVTGSQPSAAPNFGSTQHPENDVRYERGEEYIEIVKALWESWDREAIIADQASGVFLDPSKVRRVPYKGKHFEVDALFNVPRSPQGTPVLFHAGSSDYGRGQGARHADAIFTAQPTIGASREFYADFKQRVTSYGRNPEHTLVLPGILPIIGSTEEEAQRHFDDLNALIDIEASIPRINQLIHLDLTDADLDAPISDAVWQVGLESSFSSRVAVIRAEAEEKKFTARQVVERTIAAFGHHLVIGTPEQVADNIELWFKTEAADGFNYKLSVVPDALEVYIEELLPLLQGKGIFRKEYKKTTLRGHYGLPVPTE